MKFVSLTAALAFALSAFAQETKTLTYDMTYDDGSLSLASVACSNGPNGLLSKGYNTLGDLGTFPNVGGVYTVTGWNSPACGTCYNVTYGSVTLAVLAVDVSGDGLNLSLEAMNSLTNGMGYQLGSVDVMVTQIDPSACGLW